DESPFARRLNPWAVRHADWVTCDSHDQAGVLRSWGANADRVSVIGWGVDREQFHADVDGRGFARALGIPDTARVLLSPRQWNANSHVAQIVAAHGRLGEDVYLMLKSFPGRGGDATDEVERAVTDSPARDRIRTVGDLEPGDLPAMYAAADVVISCCATDGTPVSVLEAMAVGRFIVALDNPSLAEWVSQPGGSLVEAPGPEAIAHAVAKFFSEADGAARARAHNVAVISQRADRATEFRRMDGIYEQLLQERTLR
ncbi:MAG: glycosyltransferase family 4 protein, partial [Trebonia sp.]